MTWRKRLFDLFFATLLIAVLGPVLLLLLGWLTAEQGALLFVLSAMPTAISTFAFAVEFEAEVERVAIAVVVSTAMAVLWIPLVVTLVG